MDELTAQSVKDTFDINFQNYCLHRKIELKQDKCGAFIAPNIDTLTECIQVLDRLKKNTDNKLRNLQRFTLPQLHPDSLNRQYGQYRTNNSQRQKFDTQTTNHTWFANVKFNSYLHNSSSILPNYKDPTNTPQCIFSDGKSSEELYHFIIKMFMKDTIITDYEDSIPLISLLLDKTQERHKRFHYFSVLKHIIQNENCKENLKCRYAIPKQQLKKFFDLIFTKVIPIDIFGKLKNLKKIKKAMFHYLDSPCFKPFNLKPYIEKLDITCITWLKDIKSIKTKWLIMAKFTTWLFSAYLLKILHNYCHITASVGSTERLYILYSIWNNMQRKYLKGKMYSTNLQPNVKCNVKGGDPPTGVYKLFPKYSNIRPIFKLEDEEAKNNHLHIMLTFLKQLYITKYRVNNFERKWKSIVQNMSNSKTTPLYFVSCDVRDAFGSIIHEKLYDIIRSLCEDLPEDLVLKYYVIKNTKFKDIDVCYKQFFSDPNLLLPLAPGTLFAYSNTNVCQQIKKSWLLEQIRKQIFLQRVKISGNVHIVGEGLVQGSKLSPILSNIYYNFVLHKEMTKFLKTGEIIKYIDDILYVTDNEDLAKQFLQLTQEGISQYNCCFTKQKTQSNVVCDENTRVDDINYIGLNINCLTLEVTPKYSDSNLCYLMSFTSKANLPPLQLLGNRLNNLSVLKLLNIMFDNTVNSEAAIMKILKNVSLFQAKRAFILIKKLFNNIQMSMNVKKIFKVIKNNNERIARHIIKIFLKFHETMDKSIICMWNNKILCFLWTSYRKVFMVDSILQHYFVQFFQEVINDIKYRKLLIIS